MLSRGQSITEEAMAHAGVDPTAAVCGELEPGEASFHHFRLVHRSNPNRSDDRRIGLAIRYMSAKVTKVVHPTQGGAQESATLVRGRYEPTPPGPLQLGFQIEPSLLIERPSHISASPQTAEEEDDIVVTPVARAAHARAMDLENRNYFAGAAPEARYT